MPKGNRAKGKHQPKGVIVLHQDRDILVVDKAPGVLTIGTQKQELDTAYRALADYVRKGNPKSRERIFIVHRLDREVSGLLVFARSPEAQACLQDSWDTAEKTYLAVVHGTLAQKEGVLRSYLTENTAHKVFATADPAKGRLSQTAYRVLREINNYSLLEIKLLTGRKHQIRVHLADAGHPIVGDKKYGQKDGHGIRIALHAVALSLTHPWSGERLHFTTRIPPYFERFVGPIDPGLVGPPTGG